MGIDWFRVRVRADTDRVLLDDLVERQATAFQSIQSMWIWNFDAETGELGRALQERLHNDAYLHASNRLEQLLEFPEWDQDSGHARDFPDLAVCFRVYPITKSSIFP